MSESVFYFYAITVSIVVCCGGASLIDRGWSPFRLSIYFASYAIALRLAWVLTR